MITVLIIIGLVAFSGVSLMTLAAVAVANSIEVPQLRDIVNRPAISRPVQDVRLTTEEQALLNALNDYRRQVGARPLTINASLQNAARVRVACYARDGINPRHIACGRPIDFHTRQSGYYGRVVGENTAQGYPTINDAVFRGWHNSRGHRLAMQDNSWASVGIAVQGRTYVTVFGK